VIGDLIGGQAFFADDIYSSAFRADITDLGLVSAGANSLTVDDLIFTKVANGAGILVVFDDGSGFAEIDVRDGLDNAFIRLPEPQKSTVPQTITFDPAAVDRVADFDLFFSSVAGRVSGAGADRPTSIEVTVGGTTTLFSNELASLDGEEWDTVNVGFDIPAGASSLKVQAFSRDDNDTGNLPASFTWITAALSIQPPAALGDRVWEDLNANGIQDCQDTNGNSIIGDAGDNGPECDAGIPEVPVKLLAGDCQTPRDQMVMTDPNGFYLFPGLDPGDYCVEFGKPPADFCATDGFDLGEPQFTTPNAGNDNAVDSDADTTTGVTAAVSLAAGDTDLKVDAGIICPAKIGDRVWSDDNGNGIQDDGEDGVEGVKTTLFECGDDMVAGTPDDVETGEMRNTGTDGMYMYGAEPNFTLDPGKYFVQFVKPDGTEFTTPNVNGDGINSDCLPPDGITACTTLGSRGINLNRDCGLIPPPVPECDLELDKKCHVETPPVSGDLECEAKIAASVLEYTGPGTPSEVTVTGKDKNSEVVSSFDAATGILTVDARPGDLGAKMTITTDGVEEVIHTSCSAPYVAGQPAPLDNPKGDPSDNWLVLSFVDKNGGSASIPDNGNGDGMFTDSCTVTPQSIPSCDTISGGKPESILFRYTGGGCGDSDNDQDTKKAVCTPTGDTVSGSISVEAAGNEDFNKDLYTVIPMSVAPDGTFEVSFQGKELKSNSYVRITDGAGNSELNSIHTSCSQPLAVGDVFGSMTVAGIDGQSGGADVTYQYVVTNNGDPLTGINVTDNVLGDIAGPFNLDTDDSRTFTKSTKITGTTVNVATASTMLGGEVCSASDSTTVTVVEPPVAGGECDGKVTDLVLKNLGAGAQVRVDQKKDDVTVFDGVVPAGGEFSFSGTDKHGTLGTEISIFVNDSLNTKIHTSCSQPIGPGLVSGSFGVISGNSRNGGPLPPL
jgi:hypothetical protein